MKEWDIEVVFTGQYTTLFDETEEHQRTDCALRFCLAITKIMDETGAMPETNDWIFPIRKIGYNSGFGKIATRIFHPSEQTII